jgi:hypothetical protein
MLIKERSKLLKIFVMKVIGASNENESTSMAPKTFFPESANGPHAELKFHHRSSAPTVKNVFCVFQLSPIDI